MIKDIFKRYEQKYLLTEEQCIKMIDYINAYIKPDDFGKSTICNIYFDTPNYYLIRRSLEKPIYKEKLRIRTYGVSSNPDNVFIEIKKKYDGIVYKRRTRINYLLNINNLNNLNNVSFIKTNITNKQIISEIEYFTNLYKNLKPSVFLSYDRVAYISNNDENLRITFDSNIIYRDYDLTFKSTIYGKEILPHNMVLLEIKTASNYPLWLTNFLSKEKIYQTSFSKYGKAYMSIIKLPENYEHI